MIKLPEFINKKSISKYVLKPFFALFALGFLIIAIKKLWLFFPCLENENKYDAILNSINTTVILIGGFLSVFSFVTTNRKNYNIKILDKKADLAGEIMEQFQKVKNSIFIITHMYSHRSEESKDLDEIIRKRGLDSDEAHNIRQTDVFNNRFNQEIETFKEWSNLAIKAKIYLPEISEYIEKTNDFIRNIKLKINLGFAIPKESKHNDGIWEIFINQSEGKSPLSEIEKDLENELSKYLKEEIDNI